MSQGLTDSVVPNMAGTTSDESPVIIPDGGVSGDTGGTEGIDDIDMTDPAMQEAAEFDADLFEPSEEDLVEGNEIVEVDEVDVDAEPLFLEDTTFGGLDIAGLPGPAQSPLPQAGAAAPAAMATFPRSGNVVGGWTTVASSVLPSSISKKVKAVELTNDTFNIAAQTSQLPRPVVTFQNKKAIKVHFSKGSTALRKQFPPGGCSFYARGTKTAGFTLASIKAKEVSFGYSIWFEGDFGFQHGGKLPGLYGGRTEAEAMRASGGNQSENAFSARFMWRDNGKGELYCYLPRKANAPLNFCGANGNRACAGPTSEGLTFGQTIGTGRWMFKRGQWNTVRQVLRLNDPGQKNGSLKVYVNGSDQPVFETKGRTFGVDPKTRFWGVQVQSFFGGHEPKYWGSPKEQHLYFADFTCIVSEQI